MKTFTKEWYKKMQCVHYYIGLKINNDINKNNEEEIYKKVYETKKEEYIKYWTNVDDLIKKLSGMNKNNSENDLIIIFDRQNKERTEYIKKILPETIINKITSIRLLSFDYCTQDEYEIIKSYCKDCEKTINESIKKYDEYIKKTFKDNELKFIEESFHDCLIKKCKKDDNNLVLKLDNKGGFTDKKKIIFKNVNIILDEDIVNNTYIYDEIYKNNNKYEVHVLTGDDELRELILECEDIIVK